MASVHYHVFLSHTGPDKPAVEDLARRLVHAGIEPWLDTWNLVPGVPWMPALEDVLARCDSCAVFIGPAGMGAWQHEEMQAAINRRVTEGRTPTEGSKPFRVIPVLLPGADRPERSHLPRFLTATTWVEFRATLDDEQAFHRLVSGIRGVEPGAGPGAAIFAGACPYRGLEAFDVEHAPFFFGREALTEWLVDALRPSAGGRENRFLALVGASGSGKSSLARAGLVAALRGGAIEGSADWPAVILKPGRDPIESLAVALAGLDGTCPSPVAVQGLMAALRSAENILHLTARLALRDAPPSARLLLLVDQFEEVFTLCEDEAARQAFFANLLYAPALVGGQAIVVPTMRADFYGKCGSYPALAAALSDHQILVGPMTRDELRRAIERPALLTGGEFEPGLVELLLEDVTGRLGALPLLQFTLMELWQRRDGRRLTVAAYRAIGGIGGALERRANDVLAHFDDAQREVCRRIFLRLIEPGEGTEDTKRRASFSELITVAKDGEAITSVVRRLAGARLVTAAGDEEAVRAVVSRLADARLITTEGDAKKSNAGSIEVAHEALIRGWGQLRRWIESDRAGLRTHRRLTEAAHEWDQAGREPSFLFAGARLAEAREWAGSPSGDLTLVELEFLGASIAAERKRRADEVEAARRLAAEAEARRLAEAEAARRQSRLAGILKVVAAVALALAAAAFYSQYQAIQATADATRQKNKAEENEKIAQAEMKKTRREATRAQTLLLLARSNKLLNQKPQLALLLTLEAIQLLRDRGEYDTNLANQGEEVLNLAFSNLSGVGLYGHAGRVNHLAYAPDGRTLASASSDGTVRLWDAAAVAVTPPRVLRHNGPVRRLVFAPDGRTLAVAAASNEGEVWLWDLAAPDPAARPRVLRRAEQVEQLAIAPDGRTLATGHVDGTVRLWDLTAPDPAARPRVLKGPEGSIIQVAFAPEGRVLATLSADGAARLWDLTTSDPATKPRVLRHDGQINYVVFAPDGRTLASASNDGVARLWNLASSGLDASPTLLRHNRELLYVAFAPDGRTLASATNDGAVRLWNLASSDPYDCPTLLYHSSPVLKVAFAPDGRTLVTATSGGALRLWDLATAKVNPRLLHCLRGHDNAILQVEFGPDGKTLASISNDGTARLWDLAAPDPITNPRVFCHQHNVDVYRLAFTPDGNTLASASGDGTVRLWDLTAPDPAAHPHILPHDQLIDLLAVAPDGRTLASADGYLRTDLFSSGDSTVRLWDLTDPNPAAKPRLLHHNKPVLHIAFTPNNLKLVTGTIDGTVRLWDLTDPGAKPRTIQHDGLSWFAIAPDGRTLASGSREGDGTVRLWDLTAPDLARASRVLRNDAPTHQLAFAPDGKTLASACGDGTVRLWDLTAPDPAAHTRILKGHRGEIFWVAFAPDGKTLASGALKSSDGTIRLWDLTAADPAASPRVVKGHEKTLLNVIFAPDGKMLASASIDGTVRLWDLTAPDPAAGARVFYHDGPVFDVAFSPDGQTLVSACGDGTVRLWMLDRDKLMLQARSKLGRNLTPDEWTQYFPASEPYHRTFPDLPVVGEGAAPAKGEAGHQALHLTATAQAG